MAALLKGDNSEEAFAELVRQHATSGVSGVVPKFLDEAQEPHSSGPSLAAHKKASLITRRHIIKGSSKHLPFVALNEHLSPAYDMLTTSVYAGFQHNPPGIEFMGNKTWAPGKNLQKFIAAHFGIAPKAQMHMVEAISDAVADIGPQIRDAMTQHSGFSDVGKRMLMAWAEGVQGLRDQRVYAMGDWRSGDAFEGFSAPAKLKSQQTKIGRSPLMGRR